MTEFSVSMGIAAIEAQRAIVPTDTLIDQLKAAMRVTCSHWLVTNENEQFHAAVGAVMLHYGVDSEECVRLRWELQQLQRFGAAITAAQSGVGVDWASLPSVTPYEPVGLWELWRSIRREQDSDG